MRDYISTHPGELKASFLDGLPISAYVKLLVPLTFNARERAHWSERREEKALWSETLFVYLGGYGPWKKVWPKGKLYVKVRGRAVSDPRRVSFGLEVGRKRLQDPGNWGSNSKSILDALVTIGWLVDDDARWLSLESSIERQATLQYTRVTLRISERSEVEHQGESERQQ